jgi:hypothetical protein
MCAALYAQVSTINKGNDPGVQGIVVKTSPSLFNGRRTTLSAVDFD